MVKFQEFEELMVEWLWEIYGENECVTDEIIRENLKEFSKV